MLKRRKTVNFGKGLKPAKVDWKEILKNNEQAFLTDNQLSAFVDRKNPGCERLHFYPLPFPHEFSDGKWSFEELVNHDSLRSKGPSLDFTAKETTLEFMPHLIQKTMKSGKTKIVERSAVNENTLLIEWNINGLDSTVLTFELPFFDAKVEKINDGICVGIKKQAFSAMVISGVESLEFQTAEKPFSCKATLGIDKKCLIYVAISFGYDQTETISQATRAAGNPEKLFKEAEETWNHYFTKNVPHFVCSDKKLEKLYYYQAYTTRANLYDIPFEPFTHAYTCPWKTGAVWQWSWNTPMNSVAERWLNDKRIGQGSVLLERDNGGGLNIGTYLHPVKKVEDLRGHNEHCQTIGKYRKKLPPKFDLIAATTLPHTTPNGLLGAWEIYVNSGDKQYLRGAFEAMCEAEAEFSKHALPNGLYTTSFVDEFDYSLRLKPFIKAFKKGDPEMMLKMDTPFIAIDYNCYLYELRQVMILAAAVLKRPANEDLWRRQNAKLKAAINQYLWDEKAGYYFDADPRTMKRSNVKMITAFSALYAGVADATQAERMVKRLTSPKEFGTKYPCPSVSMDTSDVDPSLPTYGGGIEITSGLWFTVEGLVRYGYYDLAAKYINKAIEMMTLEGPSSSYSYHSKTGKFNQDKHTLASQGTIMTDLICKYIIGLNPSLGKDVEINPLALQASGIKDFTFGPYRYKKRWVTIQCEDGEVSLKK
jgi:hypothetical protein